MCGIIGAATNKPLAEKLIQGLLRQEYRGYDSSGLAVFSKDSNQIDIIKKAGKVLELKSALEQYPLSGDTGIAHTRWATHGLPEERNAHPHQSNNEVYVVHNGIIENYKEIKTTLMALDYKFTSDTDSEVIAHLIHAKLQKDKIDLVSAVQEATKDLNGAFALGVIHKDEPQVVVSARKGSPLVLGKGKGENFIASDQLALSDFVEEYIFLEEGDTSRITPNEITIWNEEGKEADRPVVVAKSTEGMVDKGHYRHFMQKEIQEQPEKIEELMMGQLNKGGVNPNIFGPTAPEIFSKVNHVQIVACGTSYHAGLVAKYWMEGLAGISCSVDVASEFRYRNVVVKEGTLFVTLSQSGETADTLACLRDSAQSGYVSRLAICNVPTSSLARESDLVFLTRAGPEIGVASTKAFTTQLLSLLMLTLVLGREHGLSQAAENAVNNSLRDLPNLLKQVMDLEPQIVKMAEDFDNKEHALFLGRGIHYPIAMEGALKLKELSYLHAEGYPAGEMKHGPLALIEEGLPVIVIAPNDRYYEKTLSNTQEVIARGGKIFFITDNEKRLFSTNIRFRLRVPRVDNLLSPLLLTIPLQLLAYHVALLKDCDIDKPRNLAKSVTVE